MIVTIDERDHTALRARASWARTLPMFSLHTLPPFHGKLGIDLRLQEIGQVAVSQLELKMRQLSLADSEFARHVLVEPRVIDQIAPGTG